MQVVLYDGHKAVVIVVVLCKICETLFTRWHNCDIVMETIVCSYQRRAKLGSGEFWLILTTADICDLCFLL